MIGSLPFAPKPRPCRHCGSKFVPARPLQQVCSPVCAARKVRVDKAAAKIAERAKDRQAREDQKSIKTLLAEAQKPFNEFIRLRDADQPCISCGATNPPMKPGGQWDAGHFLSRGAYPELRFEELNCHKQCKVCNAGAGKFAHKERTVRAKYEANLPSRIGQAAFDWLMGPHEKPKWQRDQVFAIKATYTQKLKDLRKEREA